MRMPEPWKDEKAIETDLRLWLQTQTVEHDKEVLRAFRIGWKAGAKYSTERIWNWIVNIFFGHREPERKEQDEGNE